MRLFSFLVVAFVAIGLLGPLSALSALPESDKTVEIKSISHSKDSAVQETISFKCDAPVVPKIFIIRGEKPRLVIDFPETIYLGKNSTALTDSLLASTIRVGLHQTPVKRTRVVIDLAKELAVQYASEYDAQNNTLTVTLTTDTLKPQSGNPPSLQSQSKKTQPIQDKATVQSPNAKTPVPVVAAKRTTKEAPPATVSGSKAAPVTPTILDISFDDSSSRGEMVLFRLNEFYPPTVSAIEKNSPRVLCDFKAMNVASDVKMDIKVKGKYIQRIHTSKQHSPERVHVVLDLSPNLDYDLQQVFFRNDNLFVLIVNELVSVQATK